MSSETLSFDIPNTLIEHLNKGDCVLFVGDALDGHSQSQRLATLLADRSRLYGVCPLPVCQEQGRCGKPGRCAIPFQRAAQLHQSRSGRHDLIRCVRDLVEVEYSTQPVLPIWRAVTSLPARIIVTTAYDRRLEEALRQAGRRVNVVTKDANVPFDDPEWVQLIYLHGRLDQPDESLTLTSDDAADLFGRLPTVATILRGLFASKTLLFLGYGLADPHFETLYQQVSRPIGALMPRAFGVQWPADPLAVDRWRGKIDLAQVEPLDYLKELAGRVRIQRQVRQAGTLPPAPYKFLDYFTEADHAIFFGRDLEADLLLSTVLAHRFSVFYGRSGTGKTSLLLARVGPKLAAQDYKVVYARMLGDPAAAVKAAVRGVKPDELAHADQGRRLVDVLADAMGSTDRLVIVLDQFEEFFVRQGDAVRQAFAQELRDCLWPANTAPTFPPPPPMQGGGGLDLRVVLSLRDDYLGNLDELTGVLPHDVFAHRYRIQNLDAEKATLAIIKPAERFGLPVEEALCERLVADLEDRGVEPANLQIVLHELYQDVRREGLWDEGARRGAGLTLARYQALNGTAAILAGYLDRVLAELEPEQQEQARTILKSMVTAQRTKAAVTGQEIVAGDLVARLHVPVAEVQARLAFLRNRGVVRKFGDEDRYELAHEVMVDKVWQWMNEDDLRLLDMHDMLRRAMSDYGTFRHLLDSSKLALLDGYRDALALEAGELEFLLLSALAAGHEVPAWFRRAYEAGVPVDAIVLKGLRSDNFRARAAAAALAQLGERFADDLISLLADLYPQVRAAAIASLERLRPDGAWRSHLKYECYVPAGEFIMGDDNGDNDEQPTHSVTLNAYYIGKYLVTNAEYSRYRNDIRQPFEMPAGKQDHPVVEVNWYDARDYAAWASMRLLTEAEWEKAASWELVEEESGKPVGKGRKRKYPWGDEFDKGKCNSEESGIGGTTPVGAYSPDGNSPYGAADMAGNVQEWVADWYDSGYYARSQADNPQGPESGSGRVVRGRSFILYDKFVGSAFRYRLRPNFRDNDVGFRVVCVSALTMPLDSGHSGLWYSESGLEPEYSTSRR